MPYASERSDFTVLTGYCWLGKKRRYGRRPGWSRAGAFHFSEEPLILQIPPSELGENAL